LAAGFFSYALHRPALRPAPAWLRPAPPHAAQAGRADRPLPGLLLWPDRARLARRSARLAQADLEERKAQQGRAVDRLRLPRPVRPAQRLHRIHPFGAGLVRPADDTGRLRRAAALGPALSGGRQGAPAPGGAGAPAFRALARYR